MLKSQKGFTLIELVMIIVILGILAAVAIPKYVDMSTNAEKAQADGVFGAAQAAAAITFANNRVNKRDGSATELLTTGAELLAALDSPPTGWTSGASDIHASINGNTYTISLSSNETITSKATLTTSW